MKKIIYTTDYSENSKAALRSAAFIAQLLNADLIALHVYAPSAEHNHQDKKEVIREHHKKLKAFCSFNSEVDTSEITVAATAGSNIAESILEFVRDMNVQMIVMGACGKNALKDRLLGSTTNHMIGISPFPVLAVPSGYEFRKLTEVLFTSVFDEEDIYYLGELARMLAPVNATMKVVHVTHRDEEAAAKNTQKFKDRVRAEVDYDKIEFQNVFSFRIFETLQENIEQTQPDLVVMPERRGKNGITKMIIRERIQRMQSCTKVPLLSFPPPFSQQHRSRLKNKETAI